MKVLGEEAEWNWGLFFANIENSEYRTSFVDSAAENVVKVCTISCPDYQLPVPTAGL